MIVALNAGDFAQKLACEVVMDHAVLSLEVIIKPLRALEKDEWVGGREVECEGVRACLRYP